MHGATMRFAKESGWEDFNVATSLIVGLESIIKIRPTRTFREAWQRNILAQTDSHQEPPRVGSFSNFLFLINTARI